MKIGNTIMTTIAPASLLKKRAITISGTTRERKAEAIRRPLAFSNGASLRLSSTIPMVVKRQSTTAAMPKTVSPNVVQLG